MFEKKIKKIDLSKNLSNETGFSVNYSKKLVNDLIEIISQNIKGGNFNLKNIGTFKLINKNERIGRNPKTKEEFKISARKSISFTPSRNITDELEKFNG